MKLTFYIGVCALLCTTACTKELQLYPETEKVAGNFYRNEAEIEEAVNAAYAALQKQGVYDIGMLAVGEIPGEDAYDETPANDGGVYGMLDLYNVIPQSSLIQDIWQDSYIGIQRANIVLNRIPPIAFAKEENKNSRIGEMKFVRALLYFNLVRTYGDVPLVIEEVSNPQAFFGKGRIGKDKVYAQIRTDLTEAIDLLPYRNESNKGRVFKSSAQALLGKVEMTLGNLTTAKALFEEVIKPSAGLQLLSNPAEVFSLSNELNKEILFAVQFASGVNSNSEGTDAYRMFNPTGRVEGKITGTKGHGVLKGEFYNLYAANDKRKDVYVKRLPSGLAYNNKIAVPSTVVEDSGSDFVVLRLADIILLLAEIENESGDADKAVAYLDMIRQRAGIGGYTGVKDKSSVFEEIDLQRRKELVCEGHRWFDILRNGRSKTVLGITDTNKLLMPVPASQIAADGSIKQNPGY